MDSDLSDNNKNQYPANSLRDFLIGLSRPVKQLVSLGTDAIGIALSCITVSWLLFGTILSAAQVTWICVAAAAVGLLLAWFLGLYRSIVRYMGLDLFVAGAITAAGSAAVGAIFLYFAKIDGAPFRWAVAFWARRRANTSIRSGCAPCANRFTGRAAIMNAPCGWWITGARTARPGTNTEQSLFSGP